MLSAAAVTCSTWFRGPCSRRPPFMGVPSTLELVTTGVIAVSRHHLNQRQVEPPQGGLDLDIVSEGDDVMLRIVAMRQAEFVRKRPKQQERTHIEAQRAAGDKHDSSPRPHGD